MTAATAGIDIGGTKILGAVCDAEGVLLAEERVASPSGWPEIRTTMVDLVERLRAAEPSVGAVGVGAAGMVDRNGTVHYAPNVLGFRRIAVQDELTEAIQLPVVVDNDANAAVIAETQIGAARGARDAVMVTLGTGIGGGIVAGGVLLRGAHGFAGEIGHFQVDPDGPWCACGERGHWEAFASGNALGRMGREAAMAGGAPSVVAQASGDVAAITGHHVTAAAEMEAPDALALVDRYAFHVAIGLVTLANVFDPEIIVISGGLVTEGELILAPVRRHFLEHLEGVDYRPVPAIVAATLGERAGVVGAALLARVRL